MWGQHLAAREILDPGYALYLGAPPVCTALLNFFLYLILNLFTAVLPYKATKTPATNCSRGIVAMSGAPLIPLGRGKFAAIQPPMP
jgi:hypothetical protein